MPAQPPFLTPTRTATTGCAAFAITYLIRSAAAPVSRITCGRGRGVAIISSPSRSIRALLALATLNVGRFACQRNSPHVEHGARLVRHAALIPRRVPDDVGLDRAA